MKLRSLLLVIALCAGAYSCTTSKVNSVGDNVLTATELQPYGRYMLVRDQPLALISSAVHFGYTFEGTESQIFASVPAGNTHGYLQYVMDGEYQGRIKVSSGSTEPVVIKAPSAGKHTVWVYKATEASNGPILIEKVTGDKVAALSKPNAPLIEFIGNSITSGAAADFSEVPCGAAEDHDQHNAYMAYGPRVARMLGADFIVSSVSGSGIYRNSNSDSPTFPQVYEKIDFQVDNNRLWDFDTFSPAIVSIALGTNDLSSGDGTIPRAPFDSTRFVDEYIRFVQLVKDIYPDARIALLNSPVLKGDSKALLENSLMAVKEQVDALYPKDKPVALHFFKPIEARGCSGHPSVEDHAQLAREIEPFFKDLLQAQEK